jgi:hypothetical protein
LLAARSVLDGVEDGSVSAALEQAIAFAKENQQLVVWDQAPRPWAVAVYDADSNQLCAYSDEDAAKLLNRDPLIRKQWKKWNAMTGNRGSLILLDIERACRVLEPDETSDDENEGLK